MDNERGTARPAALRPSRLPGQKGGHAFVIGGMLVAALFSVARLPSYTATTVMLLPAAQERVRTANA